MSSYTPILPAEIVVGSPVKPSIIQRLDANDQAVPSPQVFLTGALNTWTAPESKYYRITMTARGGNGGASNNGGAGASGIVRLYITKGTLWTATFNIGSGADTVFSDGVNTLTVQNGLAGGLLGGQTSTGMDVTFVGSLSASIYGDAPLAGQIPPYGAGGRIGGVTAAGPALIIIEG